jgi:ribosomal protein S18 acetylase RimI-like enzyme
LVAPIGREGLNYIRAGTPVAFLWSRSIMSPSAPDLEYSTTRLITPPQFVDVLKRSGLAERRPVNDAQCIESMLAYANLLCTAWAGERLVGVARSVTDFAYCCYLSDLAVDRAFQNRGVGRDLVRRTQERLGAGCRLILLSAPAAVDYYPRIGFAPHPSAWTIGSREPLTG